MLRLEGSLANTVQPWLPFFSPPSRCICFFPSGDSTCRQVDCEGNAFFDENERLRSQKSATHLYFQVVYHRLAEFYRDELSYGVVEADNILRRLGIFGLQGDHHILVKLLKFTDVLSGF